MKTTLAAFLLTTLFSSCFKYQYYAISSDRLPQNDTRAFVQETDSMKITYNFFGDDGPVTIGIENKSAKAISLDWQRSQLIIAGEPRPLIARQTSINGRFDPPRTVIGTGTFSGQSQTSADVQFLPPGSNFIRTCDIRLNPAKRDETGVPVQKQKYPSGYGKMKFRKETFTKQNSPLQYRVYLSFLRDDGSRIETDETFYVSEWTATKVRPIDLYGVEKPGNLSYRTEATGGTATAFVFGGIAALAAVVIVAVSGDDEE